MKFKAPDKISAVSLSTGHYVVANGLIEVPEVSEADGDALKAFGFERYTSVQDGTFRGQVADGGPHGTQGTPDRDEEGEPSPGEAQPTHEDLTEGASSESEVVAEAFTTKDAAVAFAEEHLDLSLDRRRSLAWMNKAIREAVAKRQHSNGAG